MITCRVLNRRQSSSLVLIHGLFTSAGFWLPYLPLLREYRLVCLEVDYTQIDQTTRYFDRVEQILLEQSSFNLRGIISHSLGTLLATGSDATSDLPRFDICPVYCAKRTNLEAFIVHITKRAANNWNRESVLGQLSKVDRSLSAYEHPRKSSKRELFIPRDDQFFIYSSPVAFCEFNGDHFEIGAAVAGVMERLQSHTWQ